MAAGIVALGTHALGFGVAGFARANVAIVLVAIAVAVVLLREYSRRASPASANSPSDEQVPGPELATAIEALET